jgi:hypothetical protein
MDGVEAAGMTAYRLRIEVPASAIATDRFIDRLQSGVLSVDLHEVDGDLAVDELVVDLPGEHGLPTLLRTLDEDPAMTLLSSRRCEPDEVVNAAYRWMDDTATTLGPPPADPVGARLAKACPFSKNSVRSIEEVAPLPVVQIALARGGSAAQRCTELPDDLAITGPRGTAWLLAVTEPGSHPSRVALLARPVSLRFAAHEVARVRVVLSTTNT